MTTKAVVITPAKSKHPFVAIEPDCVDISRLPPESEPGPHFAMGKNARESNRQTGERMVNDETEWLGDKVRELLAAYESKNPRKISAPLTRSNIYGKLLSALNCPLSHHANGVVRRRRASEDSVWYANWKVQTADKNKNGLRVANAGRIFFLSSFTTNASKHFPRFALHRSKLWHFGVIFLKKLPEVLI